MTRSRRLATRPLGQVPGGVEPPAGVGQSVHRVPLPRPRLGEIPLSGDLVPARFYPLGVERAQPVGGRLHSPLGVRQLELGLPVGSLRGGELLLRLAQVRRASFSSADAGAESSSSSTDDWSATSTSSTTRSRPLRARRAASSSSTGGRSSSAAGPADTSTGRSWAVDPSCGTLTRRGRGPKPLWESGRTRRPLRMVSAPARSTRAACSVASTSDSTVGVSRTPASSAWACARSSRSAINCRRCSARLAQLRMSQLGLRIAQLPSQRRQTLHRRRVAGQQIHQPGAAGGRRRCCSRSAISRLPAALACRTSSFRAATKSVGGST